MAVLDITSISPSPARVGRWLLTLLASLLYGLGWTARRTIVLTVEAAVWSASLVTLGWHEAARPRAG